MLIRSQDKVFLLNFNNLTAIYMKKIGKDFAIVYNDFEDAHTLGKYSTEAKVIKVLDMIQKRYVDYKTTHTVANGLATMSLFVNESDDVDKMYTKTQNVLKETVVFQMPNDNEVKV